MKAKLKPWEEILREFHHERVSTHRYKVRHSNITSYEGTNLTMNIKDWPDGIIEVELSNNYGNRIIYRDIQKGFMERKSYYDEWFEWFEWIGEEPPIIEPLPESLWDISDW